MTRTSILPVGSLAGVVVAVVLAACGTAGTPVATAPDAPRVPSSPPVATTSPGPPTTSPAVPDGRATPLPPPSPTPTATPTSDPRSGSAGPRGDDAPVLVQGRVVDIVDGDTIDLADGTRVRLAIVDTPEVYGGVEPCGPEASDFTGRFLAGQTVAVYRPEAAPARDDFGRTVGEVVRVVDGASLNVALVAAGLAEIDERFTAEDPDLARRLEAAAAGVDAPACLSDDPDPGPAAPPPADGSTATHTGRTDGGWACHPAYRECLPQVDDLDCGQVGHQVALLGDADPYRLDGNSTSRQDGLGCASSPAWSASATYPYY